MLSKIRFFVTLIGTGMTEPRGNWQRFYHIERPFSHELGASEPNRRSISIVVTGKLRVTLPGGTA